MPARSSDLVTLFLCGDVMLGRGIDQLLAHPSDPALLEGYVKDARDYVALAEDLHGPIVRPVEPGYVWGDALPALERAAPDARLINLETSVTASCDYWPDKGIHYRMHPGNRACLTVARIDACALANNHVLDFGQAGLLETVAALREAGLQTSGAGRDLSEARAPARLPLREGRQLLFFSAGTDLSGIPPEWAAGENQPGVDRLPDLSEATASQLAARVRSHVRPGDLAVVSIHWGSNWGYHLPAEQLRFARRLIDEGVDLIHGHSSHHPRPIELYRGKLILHGCGDFINDYEGIRGYEDLRSDLRLMYFATLEAQTGALRELRVVPLQTHALRLRPAGPEDVQWLSRTLSAVSEPYGVRLLQHDGELVMVSRG